MTPIRLVPRRPTDAPADAVDGPRHATVAAPPSLADEVRQSLQERPRRLPAHALYDALGSSLFDAICHLPWYPITRAETALLHRHRRPILETAGSHARIVELGPGNGDKLATLLADPAWAQQAPAPAAASADPSRDASYDVHLVDVSASALDVASARLRRVPGVSVTTHVAKYETGLREVAALRQRDEPLLVCFLGSNIGNFDPADADALLADVRDSLRHGDTLLIGADLVKPIEQLQLAYDDPLGVTAAFNCNLLVRLNREMDADFQLNRFAHDARWNDAARRMEMHLVSLAAQRVHIPGARLVIDLRPAESIWTESSYKYEPKAFADVLWRAGFTPLASWEDDEAGFLLTLASMRQSK